MNNLPLLKDRSKVTFLSPCACWFLSQDGAELVHTGSRAPEQQMASGETSQEPPSLVQAEGYLGSWEPL